MNILPNHPALRLLLKGLVFAGLNLCLLAGLLWHFSGQQRGIRLSYAESESNFLVQGGGGRYDAVLLGTSRGRVFSRDGNHELLERVAGGRIANLSKGGGGGLMPAELHLAHFFARGNRASHVIYLVDPWVFFSAVNNEENDFFLRDEPFEWDILARLVLDGYPMNRISSYLQMIAVGSEGEWREISRYAAPGLTAGTLSRIDPEKMEKARQHYLDRYDLNNFEKYASYVERINALARSNGCDVTYVLLPILMPGFPGADEVDRFLAQVADQEPDVAYYNFISAMHDRRWFYDHMHFNSAGIERFAGSVLHPLLHGGVPMLD
ncbi:MAG: hypothetical protein AB7E32_05720 [Desulfovibrio sp.]